MNKKILKLTQLAKTSPHSAYHVYNWSVKDEISYVLRLGISEEALEETTIIIRKLAETFVWSRIWGENTFRQISLPKRFGGLDINITRVKEEAKEQESKCQVMCEELKNSLINQDPTLPKGIDLNEYKKGDGIQTNSQRHY